MATLAIASCSGGRGGQTPSYVPPAASPGVALAPRVRVAEFAIAGWTAGAVAVDGRGTPWFVVGGPASEIGRFQSGAFSYVKAPHVDSRSGQFFDTLAAGPAAVFAFDRTNQPPTDPYTQSLVGITERGQVLQSPYEAYDPSGAQGFVDAQYDASSGLIWSAFDTNGGAYVIANRFRGAAQPVATIPLPDGNAPYPYAQVAAVALFPNSDYLAAAGEWDRNGTFRQRIYRISKSRAQVTYAYRLPLRSSVQAMAGAADGSLWFTDRGLNAVDRLSQRGALTVYPIPTPNAGPDGIALDCQGRPWFTESWAGKIGRVDAGGKVVEYSLPTQDAAPAGIALAPSTCSTAPSLWFAETHALAMVSYAPRALR